MPIHGYPGGVISATPPTVNNTTASGVWTTEKQLQYQAQGVWPPAVAQPISRSLRFNSADSAYLSRTPASASNRKTWTWSGWVKRSIISTDQTIFDQSSSATNSTQIRFLSTDVFRFYTRDGASDRIYDTTAVFRDVSAWYHIVVAVDTTQSTASDRVKVYFNNALQTISAGGVSQNADTFINSTSPGALGRFISGSNYCNLYLAEINFIDGQQLTPSSFGQTNSNTGVWEPKAFSGTYGTNGFYLNFSDNSGTTSTTLGKDYSGNNNNWTPNNFSVSTGQVSVASATGGLPILNTTDTYGTTVGSGVRSDSFASSLVLAVPGATSSGLLLTDQIPSGRTQAAQTITNNGTSSTTSTSKFYSGSATVANGQDFSIAYGSSLALGTTFTVEFWAKPDSSAAGNEKTISTYGINEIDGYVIMVGQGGARFRSNGQTDLTWSGTVTDWTHFAFVASGGNSKKIYVNGTLVASDSNTINASGAYTTYIGSSSANGSPFRFTGQWQDYRIYKGVAKYTSDFTVVSATPNPATAAGYDSMVDTPTNYGSDTGAGGTVRGNYCTLNPLDLFGTPGVSNGNLSVAGNSGNNFVGSTFPIFSGKWYFEYTNNQATTGSNNTIGLMPRTATSPGNAKTAQDQTYSYAAFVQYAISVEMGTTGANAFSKVGTGGSSTNTDLGWKYTSNDIVNVAIDFDNKKVWFGKNGTWYNSGVPASGTNATATINSAVLAMQAYDVGYYAGAWNFGQRPFAYTAPSGFKSLCTQNLSTPTVVQGDDYFNTVLYTGNGSTQSITGVGFQPDFVWYKGRSAAYNNRLYDVIRGVTNSLSSNLTDAESAISGVTAFNSDGFSLGSEVGGNNNGTTYVAWNWKANGAGSSNTAGTITSTVSANQTAGFSIVTYTGTGANATVGHGLGAAPGLVIVKGRNFSASGWIVWQAALSGTQYLSLESTNSVGSNATVWNSTVPTSTVFSLGTNSQLNGSGNTYVAYCFAAIPGYSAFGTYTGNGSADGTFVYTGFRPAWLLVKRTNLNGYWTLVDAKRNTYNVMGEWLYPNAADAGVTNTSFDFVSNGFKLRYTGGDANASGSTYIYAAFAENPFKYALAR